MQQAPGLDVLMAGGDKLLGDRDVHGSGQGGRMAVVRQPLGGGMILHGGEVAAIELQPDGDLLKLRHFVFRQEIDDVCQSRLEKSERGLSQRGVVWLQESRIHLNGPAFHLLGSMSGGLGQASRGDE